MKPANIVTALDVKEKSDKDKSSATTPGSAATPTPTPPPSVIGPLPTSKTITITFVPDWSQEDMNSPLRAASVCVLLGPANTLPQQALWSIEFNLFGADKPPAIQTKDGKPIGEEPIKKGERALLWYDGKPFPKYKNCIVLSKCRLPANGELKTHSIVLRSHADERDLNALTWVPKRAGPKRRKDLSYLKVVAGHHYYLNLTFAAGSTIAQLVGSQAWRPIIYLYTKHQKKGIDEIHTSRLFTNFTTNWAQGVEPNVDERELKLAAEALQREAEEDAKEPPSASVPIFMPGSHVNASHPSVTIMPPVNFTPPPASALTVPADPTVSVEEILAQVKKAFNFVAPDLSYRPVTAAISKTLAPYHGGTNAANIGKYSSIIRPDLPDTWDKIVHQMNSSNPTNPISRFILLPDISSRPFALGFSIDGNVEKPEPAKSYVFSLDPHVSRFVGIMDTVLAQAMQSIETYARQLVLDDIANKNAEPHQKKPVSPYVGAATHLLNFFSAINQLLGWQHVQRYIHNPQYYIELSKTSLSLTKGGDDSIKITALKAMSAPLTPMTLLDETHVEGRNVLRYLCHRVDWLLELQRKEGKAFNIEMFFRIVTSDLAFRDASHTFMKKAETHVTEMLTKNPQKFHAFRELQRKGVLWPHSKALREAIEAAGFVYRPMMIKRDLFKCEKCGVEVSGFMPWHEPMLFHNFSKHPDAFKTVLVKTLETVSLVEKAMTEFNLKNAKVSSASAASATAPTTIQTIGSTSTDPKSGTDSKSGYKF